MVTKFVKIQKRITKKVFCRLVYFSQKKTLDVASSIVIVLKKVF